MTGKKELVRGGLAAVFGGLEKKPDIEGVTVQGPQQEESIEGQKSVLPQGQEAQPSPDVPSSMEGESDQGLYAHLRRVKWPILESREPYIIPGPEGFERLNSTVNFRLPADLDVTLDAHCRSVGARKSEWIRKAIQHYLAEEQEKLR